MKIPLTQGMSALVDDEDYEELMKHKWQAAWDPRKKSFYATRSTTVKRMRVGFVMHRVILKVTDPRIKVDHRNHDTLDNRRRNLRPATSSQNAANRKGPDTSNTSGYRGVHLHAGGRWQAKIGINSKVKHLGLFDTKEKAAAAYAAANRKYFGEFGGNL
jgi:AP2 domain